MQSKVISIPSNEELISANDSNIVVFNTDGSLDLKSVIVINSVHKLVIATEYNNETYDIRKKLSYPAFSY